MDGVTWSLCKIHLFLEETQSWLENMPKQNRIMKTKEKCKFLVKYQSKFGVKKYPKFFTMLWSAIPSGAKKWKEYSTTTTRLEEKLSTKSQIPG